MHGRVNCDDFSLRKTLALCLVAQKTDERIKNMFGCYSSMELCWMEFLFSPTVPIVK